MKEPSRTKPWEKRSVIWLAGVRRVGRTYLCRSLPETKYCACDLPRVSRMMDAPESLLEGQHSGLGRGSNSALSALCPEACALKRVKPLKPHFTPNPHQIIEIKNPKS